MTGTGTRLTTRAFTARERARILEVGGCLECHEGNEPFYMNYRAAVAALEPNHPAEP